MRTVRALAGPIVALVVLTACGGPGSTVATTSASATGTTVAAGPTLISPAAFAIAMAEPGTVSIDVHIPFEGKLGADDLQIPFDEIAAHISELPADHDTPLAVYCRSGNMSSSAVRELDDLGYTDIVELAGGMDAWVTDGRPLITAP